MSNRVEALRDRFHELLLGRHRESTCEQIAAAGDESRTLSPTVLMRATYDAARAAAVAVYRALATACDAILADEQLRRHVGIGPHVDALIELDREHGQGSLMTRLDAFVGADGVARFIECNAMTPGAVPLFAKAFADLPITRELAEEFSFESILPYRHAADAVMRGRATPPTIAIVTTNDHGAFETFWMPYVAREAHWNVLRVRPSEVELAGGVLHARGIPIDFVSMPQADITTRSPEARPIFEALRAGTVRFPHGFSRSIPVDYKGTFEVLSSPDFAHLFDAQTQQMLAVHVPWTRVIRDRKTSYRGADIDLVPFIEAHRERFVIKPSGALAGAGVVLGWKSSAEAWRRALKIAKAVQCVVQERVDEGPAATYFRFDSGAITSDEYTCDLDPLVWNGDSADGAVTRIAAGGLHNQAAGGLVTALWVLADA